ncbi:MAG TPA: glycosyltransferase family 2 protein [Gryllotalpicola sp.]
MQAPVLSVVIPAHNEESRIHATLQSMLAGAADGEFDIVVSINGSTDRTADVARAFLPGIRVVETPEPSKIAALNAGDDAIMHAPIAYIDADVTVDAATLRALAAALADDGLPRVASPRFELDSSASSWPARQYFRIWRLNEYNRAGHIGSGVYAVSAAGRRRWAAFPPVIADDRFVQQLFAPGERVILPDHAFAAPAPRTLRAQIRRSVRVHTGNAELRELGVSGEESGGQVAALVRQVALKPSLWPAFAVYCVGYGLTRFEVARLRRAGKTVGWRRDDTSRAS